ncbi:transposase [Streptomyces sp. NBC_00199]|uniref:transposase n=1 Tax=Streptomyces sp. NBC_00199 TaxID=2975678 RepID=UPI0022502AEE|nr:transposase [Streptomyces sp. NBC_00199]MCX5264946.1 transposase [Streptomyces sp. NBC_00199]
MSTSPATAATAPLAILLTPGRRHDTTCARPLLERIRVPRTGLGRPRRRPDQVVADKAYSSRGFRAYLRKRGIVCTIPEKDDQQRRRHNRGRQGGRPPAFAWHGPARQWACHVPD